MKFLGFSIAILLVVLAINAAQVQGKRGGGGRRRGSGHHRHPPPICQLVNTTDNNDILCNSTCPEFAECVPWDEAPQQERPIPDGIEVYICKPKVDGQRGGRRGHSSEEDDSSDDHHRCREMLTGGRRRGSGHHRHPPPICQLVNTTDNNDILCNSTCPEFAECVLWDEAPQDRPIPDGIEVHICKPKVVGQRGDLGGQRGGGRRGQRGGGRHGHSSEGDDSSEETGVSPGGDNAELDDNDDRHRCGKMLKNITRQANAGADTAGSELESRNPDGDRPSRRLSDGPNGDNNPRPRQGPRSGPPNNGNRAINPRFRFRNNGQGADGNGPNDP